MPTTPPHPVSPVAVVGAGVVGLTTAVRLLERLVPVTVYAERRYPDNASGTAPAMFTPYSGSDPRRSRRWAEEAYRAYTDLEQREGARAGVRVFTLREYCYRPPHPSIYADLTRERPAEIAVPLSVAAVIDSERPHIDTTRFVPWLSQRAAALGAAFCLERVPSLDALLERGHRVVVNCAGVGAKELTGDRSLRAMRGIVLHCRHPAGLTRSLHDDAPGNVVTYVFRFEDHIVLGSTYERDVWEETIDEREIAAIVQRCRDLARLDNQPGWSEIGRDPTVRRVGLRPVRGSGEVCEDIRLEVERRRSGAVVHNYGHGRSGITLAWGTAAEAAELTVAELGG